jgi:hypothetical protein
MAALHGDEIYNLACPASPIHYQRDPASIRFERELSDKQLTLFFKSFYFQLISLNIEN